MLIVDDNCKNMIHPAYLSRQTEIWISCNILHLSQHVEYLPCIEMSEGIITQLLMIGIVVELFWILIAQERNSSIKHLYGVVLVDRHQVKVLNHLD